MALALAQAGADLAVLDLNAEGAEKTAAAIRGFDARVMCVRADVARREEVEAAVEKVLGTFGRLDILVNSAGMTHTTWALELDDATWERIIGVNLRGTFLCCQTVGRHMVGRREGSIINIASTAGCVGMRQKAAYTSSKGGVIQLTRALAVEWAPYMVRVNAIAPSSFETPMVRHGTAAAAPELAEHLRQLTPLGRFGRPEEIMGAVVFLASPASSMVTGHILAVDGGYLAQ